MRRRLLIFGVVLAAALAIVIAVGVRLVLEQELPEDFWRTWPLAKVRFDDHGIPTIEAADWSTVIEAEGYVVASQRLWQMDLMRRKAAGRLAEWFGDPAFAVDAAAQAEDRLAVATRGAAALPAGERIFCEKYAAGVNAFIGDNPRRWGIEYLLLGVSPEPWTCADSLLVLFQMNEALTASADGEAQAYAWRRHLSPAWQDFLFTYAHPWNHPYFGVAGTDAPPPTPAPPAFPPAREFLPRQPLDPAKEAHVVVDSSDVLVGSNNWAWRGPTGAYLANDPHLGLSVPAIWFATRLRVARDDWTVGLALPGLPGIVLGMNPALAWAFTNTGEDVDDYLEEQLSADGQSYLLSRDAQGDHWAPVEKRDLEVHVRGESAPRHVAAQFTARGPLAKRRFLGDKLYARQWLPLKAGALRLPVLAIASTRTLADFDHAVDALTAPSQNVLVVDAAGDMGYRMSGTGVVRNVAGDVPQSALAGAWAGTEPASQRRRRYFTGEGTTVRFLATANERVWLDPNGARWGSDDRKERLVSALSARTDFQRADMEALQLDTTSRFRRVLLEWIRTHLAAGASGDEVAARLARWAAWDGSSRSDPQTFTDAGIAEDALTKLLVGRVRNTFMADGPDHDVGYKHPLRRGWMTAVLLAPGDDGVAPFGLGAGEVAAFLVGRVLLEAKVTPLHPEANRWASQHPFVGRIPLVGGLFRIDGYQQWGAGDVVLAERPEFGPSVRLVWDLTRPAESTWAFPVGQSGHVLSPHFRDLHDTWQTGPRLSVFNDGFEWQFAPRTSH